jgi:hypothetical protein
MGDVSKGVANTLLPSNKNIKSFRNYVFTTKIFFNYRNKVLCLGLVSLNLKKTAFLLFLIDIFKDFSLILRC